MPRRSVPPHPTLETVAGGIAPERDLAKSERINFLVSPAEKQEIQETARAFGLTTTDYLVRLHRLTKAMLETRKQRRSKASRTRHGERHGPN